jgi:hypothetical protein
MKEITEAQLRAALADMTELPTSPPPSKSVRANELAYRRAVTQTLAKALSNAGANLGAMDRIAEERQSQLRRIFENERADLAQTVSERIVDFRASVKRRLETLNLLTNLDIPPHVEVLDEPELILQTPYGELATLLVNKQIQPGDSWVKIMANTDAGSDTTRIGFYFPWTNESDTPAVVNLYTAPVFIGTCKVSAATGFFSGDRSYLNITTSLDFVQYDWTEPPVMAWPQTSQRDSTVSLEVDGGPFWQSPAKDSKSFVFHPVELTYTDFIVPQASTVFFVVALDISYGFGAAYSPTGDGGGNINDLVLIDFATNDFQVLCPYVEVQVLTIQ